MLVAQTGTFLRVFAIYIHGGEGSEKARAPRHPCDPSVLTVRRSRATARTTCDLPRNWSRFPWVQRVPGTGWKLTRLPPEERSSRSRITSTTAPADRVPPCYALHGVRDGNERGHPIDGLGSSILPHRAELGRGVGARREKGALRERERNRPKGTGTEETRKRRRERETEVVGIFSTRRSPSFLLPRN